jgi:glutamate-1-semialdehyde 2,1-aminomutase
MSGSGPSREKLEALSARETARFRDEHPRSEALAGRMESHWLHGAPMHWMKDWASPFPIFAEDGEGASLMDVDEHAYDDFCLGDTPGMFGHAHPAIARALSEQARKGATFMLPTEEAARVGEALAARFKLPFWQTTLSASDANRALIRWARAATGRPVILVFDGCYHGMVEDCFVDLVDGQTRMDAGLIGQVHDYTSTTRVIPFNDVAALEAALAPGDVAAVLAEPAMTNVGMILPEPGFHDALRHLTRKAGALLILDETHTLSTGPAGYCGAHGLEPDALVIGKAIAGGFPAAVWGVSDDVAKRIAAYKREPGRSGVGTTLAGNAMGIAAIGATLSEIMTEANYAHMLRGAERLKAGLQAVIQAHTLPWSVVHVGARAEIVFAPKPPKNAHEMRLAQKDASIGDDLLNQVLHLYLINRGLLIAPFHMMLLISPATSDDQIGRLIAAVDGFAQEIQG